MVLIFGLTLNPNLLNFLINDFILFSIKLWLKLFNDNIRHVCVHSLKNRLVFQSCIGFLFYISVVMFLILQRPWNIIQICPNAKTPKKDWPKNSARG